MLDLEIGMNDRLTKPFQWDDSRRMDRGKVMTAEDLEAGKLFGRYLDVDDDGITYRTLPGTHPTKGAFFTRGTSKNRMARYSEEGADYEENMERLLKKHRTARTLVPPAIERKAEAPTRFGAIYYGSTTPAMVEADMMLAEQGIHLDLLRVRGFPFGDEVAAFIEAHDHVFVVEQNRDGQLRSLLVNELEIDPKRLGKVVHYDGTPISARFISGAIVEHLERAGRIEKAAVMTFLAKPKLHHPELHKNSLGYTRRDYEGTISTLCAGCGHDSISAAIVRACFELELPPHRIAKLSGIGCSSKTPTYFLGASHGFNSVHGRMPSVLTGANLANRDLIYLGVSGDGDSASIGLGQFAHSMRRGVNMVYIVENNGVYGLTKGQFSATSDKGAKSKRGVVNSDEAIDLVEMALAAWRDVRGPQLLRRQGAVGAADRGRAEARGRRLHRLHFPCVAFNNHDGSTKSFDYVREHNAAVNYLDVITGREEITVDYAPGSVEVVTQHDGSTLRLRKLHTDYDLHDRISAMTYMQQRHAEGEIVTGLLYVDPNPRDLHGHLKTSDTPLNALQEDSLVPGSAALAKINAALR